MGGMVRTERIDSSVPTSSQNGGNVSSSINTERKEAILRALDLYRGLILDSVEPEFSDSARWKYVRGRLLKFLGQNGLEGRITAIMTDGQDGGMDNGRDE
jgi:hypothetical protein